MEVLIWVPDVGGTTGWFIGSKNMWRWAFSGEIVELNVTHWMPLPDPPNEE